MAKPSPLGGGDLSVYGPMAYIPFALFLLTLKAPFTACWSDRLQQQLKHLKVKESIDRILYIMRSVCDH